MDRRIEKIEEIMVKKVSVRGEIRLNDNSLEKVAESDKVAVAIPVAIIVAGISVCVNHHYHHGQN